MLRGSREYYTVRSSSTEKRFEQRYQTKGKNSILYHTHTRKSSSVYPDNVHLTPLWLHRPPLHHSYHPRPPHEPYNHNHNHNYICKLLPPYPPPLGNMPNLAPPHQVTVPNGPLPILCPLPRQTLAPNPARVHVQAARRTRPSNQMDPIHHLGQQRQQWR